MWLSEFRGGPPEEVISMTYFCDAAFFVLERYWE
jgi:hypothetical protein